MALNVAFVAITKTTQGLDTTGVAAAAHATTIALWQLGGVVLFAMGSVATILTSAELGKKDSSSEEARAVARRVLSWGEWSRGAFNPLVMLWSSEISAGSYWLPMLVVLLLCCSLCCCCLCCCFCCSCLCCCLGSQHTTRDKSP